MLRVDVRLATAYLKSMLPLEVPERYLGDIASHQFAVGRDQAVAWALKIYDPDLRQKAFGHIARLSETFDD